VLIVLILFYLFLLKTLLEKELKRKEIKRKRGEALGTRPRPRSPFPPTRS